MFPNNLHIAILFGLVLKFGNLALVLMDTAFWQKSFASEVRSTVPAYNLVSIVILAIPWCTGTIIGLSARAIENTPVWFNYPNTLTVTQVNSGLVMPYVLKSLLGDGATMGLLVLIFMAITSTVSSSMIAVSSIISLDFFRTYVNPHASDGKILKVSHWGVVFHGFFMAGFAIMLEYAGATNNVGLSLILHYRFSNKYPVVHLLPTYHIMSRHHSFDIDSPLVWTD